jgi:hypothetical protein
MGFDNLLPIKKQGLWEYINRSGELVIKPQFKDAYSFADGYAVVKGKDDKEIYIDESLQPAPFQFDEIEVFRKGIARVRVDAKWGLINTQGDFVLPPEFTNIGFPGGELIEAKKTGHWGFFNAKGQQELGFDYADTNGFSEGLAAIKMGDKWGYIDTRGAPRLGLYF